MKHPFEAWEMGEVATLLADAMTKHRAAAQAEARALDASTVGTNRVPSVNQDVDDPDRVRRRLRFDAAFPSFAAFVAALRDEAPAAIEIAVLLLSRAAPEEVLPIARRILATKPWHELGSNVGKALGRVDDPAAVELALTHAEVAYVMTGVSSSVCRRAWPIVLERIRASRVMDVSRKHPRSETYFVESLIAYFRQHRVDEAWPVLSRLYESVDADILLATGHALIAWGDEQSLSLLRRGVSSRSDRRRFFAVRAYLKEGPEKALDDLGGPPLLTSEAGRGLAAELMEQVWRDARDARKPIADGRYLDLALAWAKDRRMLGICRYVLDSFGKAKVAAAKKRLRKGGKLAEPKPAKRPSAKDVAAVRGAMKRARKNLENIVAELKTLGYAFHSHPPLGKPVPEQTLRALEKAVGGPLPVSLRAAFEVIGSCDLTGAFPGHPASLETDAFVLALSPDIVVEALENAGGETRWPLCFAPDAAGKAGFSGGREEVLVPDPSLDGRVLGVVGEPFFLERLREVLRCGGFPGLAGKTGELGKIRRRLAKVCDPI